ncbi:MAG: gamma-glutamyltransferase [Candidatus Lokiarchaeota archaeon]|nr:gamma-glutamyltransferase [Candidatus Lokiarchaeota archaeon]MBD3341201.1 gamma-glutamyltransferase [Candidatus Lokiarchaeota archaeon]
MKLPFKWKFPYASRRMPVLAKNIVASSQPLASQAGLRMLLKGGNAVDAAIATAIALTVVEPTSNGLGSDAFAIVWDGKNLTGLNASGRSPTAWTVEHFSKYDSMPKLGWDATTVPGAVSAWVKLWEKYGTLEFEQLFEPAIDYAKKGFLVSPITGMGWNLLVRVYKKFPAWVDTFTIKGKGPKPGELFKLPYHAKTLEKIAESKGEAFYRGEIAEKIVDYAKETGGLMTLKDLSSHHADWVQPIKINYKGVTLYEIPPNGQGLAALIMLGILKNFDMSKFSPDSVESIHLQIEAMKLAFKDAHRYISDPSALEFDPELFLQADYLKERADLIDMQKAQDLDYGVPKEGDTVYLTTADENGIMVSFIQSNFWSFGSGIVIPKLGIAMQNRGNGFTLENGHPNQVGPNKRPYHTIIPAFVTRKGEPLMSYGVMGGHMQPQGHAQMMIRIFEYKQNPQAAIDALRWQVTEGLGVKIESGFDSQLMSRMKELGHDISESHYIDFGGAQIIYKLDDGYLGASESRKDGQAVGF